ncbi:MAG: hypothetical protein QOG15_80 [Solirubrobacteraceae bacterium]|nr:hypothetical protein [Solirubrobacteraceae bacterium]
MALIDDVTAACKRLAPAGWGGLLAAHGLDIGAPDLRSELLRALPDIDRTVPGFEDFADEGTRGIEPARPAQSLLYHAFASPNVLTQISGQPLEAFPTLEEIDAVENLAFGIETPSLAEVSAPFPGALMAVAVFAVEYRPAPESVHRRHADLSFSRTGVARIGTAAAHYNAGARGFEPFVDGDDHAFAVLPSQFQPYLAVQLRGLFELFGPMNFSLGQFFDSSLAGDENRSFWVPVHKLFDGEECLRGMDLSVTLEARHVNEKLRRVHRELARQGHNTGWKAPDIDQPPFVFTEGIAELDEALGPGIVAPVAHEHLVQAATLNDKPLSFRVPADADNGWAPSLLIRDEDNFRHAPEYVHVRHSVDADGKVHDLGDEADVAAVVRAGGYRAQHYVDFTGDGWVAATIPELAVQVPRHVPAYSLVTAPDFYPNCDQRELVEWWTQRVPTKLRDRIWQTPPLTLSDERLAPNLQLPDVDFRAEDDTVSAIVSMPAAVVAAQRPLDVAPTARHAHLPDGAAGVFAPGWDTSRDRTDGVGHLAAYGLGSPFPEDAKLCAALSSFWPAVAPDAGRSFSQAWPTATPLTDEEIGSVGDLPWDGVPGPRMVQDDVVEYASFDYVDYVRSALDNAFTLALTCKVGVEEYEARVLVAVRSYLALGIQPDDRTWRLLSFRAVAPDDGELDEAQTSTSVTLGGDRYRLEFGHQGDRVDTADHRKVRFEIGERATIYAGALPRLLVKRTGGSWRAVRTT